MSDQQHHGDINWFWFKLILCLLVIAGFGYLDYRAAHKKTVAALEYKQAAESTVASLQNDVRNRDAKLAAKNEYIKKCYAGLLRAAQQTESVRVQRETCLRSHDAAVADFTAIVTASKAYPPLHLEVSKEFSQSMNVSLGQECRTAEETWTVNEEDCALSLADTLATTAATEISPTIPLIVALAVARINKIAHAPPAGHEDAEISFLDGSFLHDIFGYGTGNLNDCWYISTHLFRLIAPLAADERTVDTLGTWAVTLVRDHKPFAGKSGSLAKRYLVDLWDASWADFRMIDKWAKEDNGLYGEDHVDYKKGSEEGPCVAVEIEGENWCAHELTDKLEGWFYRRWKAAGGDKKGDALIGKYRGQMITLADALGMPSYVEKWKGQLDSGQGPHWWPKPKPKSEEEEQ